MPEIEIINSPTNEQQIATNSLKVESSMIDITSFQNIKTTEQQIATNSLKVRSSVIDATTFQNIKTTVLDIDKIEKTEANILEQTSTTYLVNEKTEILKKTDFPVE